MHGEQAERRVGSGGYLLGARRRPRLAVPLAGSVMLVASLLCAPQHHPEAVASHHQLSWRGGLKDVEAALEVAMVLS